MNIRQTLNFLIIFKVILFVSCSEPMKTDEKVPGIKSAPERIVPPLSDGFDFPVGRPDARGYYNAQKFGRNFHLGDDWNGVGGGNSDFGDPVYCIANGIVTYCRNAGPGWGNVVRVLHRLEEDSLEKNVESLYAHMDEVKVRRGDTLCRGDQIGTIGDADGAYYAHLHLEIRDSVAMGVGGGYDENTNGFLDPTEFIQSNRPAK